MDQNVILKDYLHVSAENNARIRSKEALNEIFSDINPFTLFNILGKNQLFAFAIVLIILYAWFIRANISIGALFGFLVLGFIFYLYFIYFEGRSFRYVCVKNNKGIKWSEIF